MDWEQVAPGQCLRRRVALIWRPRAEIYVWGEASVVADEGEKGRLWSSGIFPFDRAPMFGSPADPGHVFIRVDPVSALVLSQGAAGLTRPRWRAHRGGKSAPPGA